MALNKGIWDPKLRGTNIKGTNLKSLREEHPSQPGQRRELQPCFQRKACVAAGHGIATRFLKTIVNFCYPQSEYLAEIIISTGVPNPLEIGFLGLGCRSRLPDQQMSHP